MDTIIDASAEIETENSEQQDAHKVILLPVKNRHTSNTPFPLTPERVAQILQEAGYKGNVIETETRRFVESGAEGTKFRIYFYDDVSTKSGEQQYSIMFNTGWNIKKDEREDFLKAANIFNMRFRYLKAYVVSEDEYAYTEAEMSFFGADGLSDDGFIALLDMFLNLRQSYLSICREFVK